MLRSKTARWFLTKFLRVVCGTAIRDINLASHYIVTVLLQILMSYSMKYSSSGDDYYLEAIDHAMSGSKPYLDGVHADQEGYKLPALLYPFLTHIQRKAF